MKFLNFNRVLCLSPHPDDTELGMLGTISKFSDTIFDIIVLGHWGDKTLVSSRGDEVKDVWETAGLPNVNLYFSPFNFFREKNELEWIGFIEDNYTKKETYDCIFIPTKDDSHFEHRMVNGWGGALCRFSPINLIEYHLPSTLNIWQPNLFIDIDEQYENKLNLLSLFKSQQEKPYFKKPMLDAFHSNFQCSKKGLHVVERFKLVDIILK